MIILGSQLLLSFEAYYFLLSFLKFISQEILHLIQDLQPLLSSDAFPFLFAHKVFLSSMIILKRSQEPLLLHTFSSHTFIKARLALAFILTP